MAPAWWRIPAALIPSSRSEEHTSELQSHSDLVCRLLLEKKNAPVIAQPTPRLNESTSGLPRPQQPAKNLPPSSPVARARPRTRARRPSSTLRGQNSHARAGLRECSRSRRRPQRCNRRCQRLPPRACVSERALCNRRGASRQGAEHTDTRRDVPRPLFFYLLTRPPPRSTLFPYTTLFR